MCLTQFLVYDGPGNTVVESKFVHLLPSPRLTERALYLHTCSYAHMHTLLHPNSSSTRTLLRKTFLCKHSQLVDLSQSHSPDSGPHHALPPWRSCWKLLLDLGCWPHVHMGLNKQANVVRGFIAEFPQEWNNVEAELAELGGKTGWE